MVVCKHCLDYLISHGEPMLVPTMPAYESGENEELDESVKCEWCGDPLEDCTELYDVKFL